MNPVWKCTVAPTEEPLDVSDVMLHATQTQGDESTLFLSWIKTARGAAEAYLNRALRTQTWEYGQDDWSAEMVLPMAAPIQGVSHVKYYDAAGTLTTLASDQYLVDSRHEPARVLQAPNVTWPVLQSDRRGPRVIVTYVCGWSTAGEVPELIKQGMRLMVTYADMDRSGSGAGASAALQAAQSLWAMAGQVHWRPELCRA